MSKLAIFSAILSTLSLTAFAKTSVPAASSTERAQYERQCIAASKRMFAVKKSPGDQISSVYVEQLDSGGNEHQVILGIRPDCGKPPPNVTVIICVGTDGPAVGTCNKGRLVDFSL